MKAKLLLLVGMLFSLSMYGQLLTEIEGQIYKVHTGDVIVESIIDESIWNLDSLIIKDISGEIIERINIPSLDNSNYLCSDASIRLINVSQKYFDLDEDFEIILYQGCGDMQESGPLYIMKNGVVETLLTDVSHVDPSTIYFEEYNNNVSLVYYSNYYLLDGVPISNNSSTDTVYVQETIYDTVTILNQIMVVYPDTTATGTTAIIENQTVDSEILANVYPNPVSSTLNIDFSRTVQEAKTINVYNTSGILMQTEQTNETNSHSINLGSVSAGTYIFEIIVGNQVVLQQTFIKE